MLAKTATASASAPAHDIVALLATISRKIDDGAQRTWNPTLRIHSFFFFAFRH